MIYFTFGLLGQKFIQDELLVFSGGASTVSITPLLQMALAICCMANVMAALGACSSSGTPLLRTSTIVR